jgi:GDP-L-fucose synthase
VVFDWLYINDLMRVIDGFIGGQTNHSAYNVTPTNSIDLVSIVNMINELSDKQSSVIVEKEGLNLEYTGSNNRLMARYAGGFKFTPMETAIQELIEYYKKTVPHINREDLIFT